MVKEIVGKFGRVLGKAYEEYGLPEGGLVFISGSGFAPVDDDDNYKLLFIVLPIKDGVPSGERGVTIARKYLEVCSDEEDATHKKVMEQKFDEEASVAAVNDAE